MIYTLCHKKLLHSCAVTVIIMGTVMLILITAEITWLHFKGKLIKW